MLRRVSPFCNIQRLRKRRKAGSLFDAIIGKGEVEMSSLASLTVATRPPVIVGCEPLTREVVRIITQ